MSLSPKDQLLTKIAAIFIIFGAPILFMLLIGFIDAEIFGNKGVRCDTNGNCNSPSFTEPDRN